MPPLSAQRSPISPELVLADRGLADAAAQARVRHRPTADPAVAEDDTRAAMLRMCELSDVNPPRLGRRRLLSLSGVGMLWLEMFLVAGHVILGLS